MNRNRFIIIVLLFIIAGSCKKSFLEVTDTQNLYRESYVKDLASMQDFVGGMYAMMSSKVEGGIVHSSYPEIVADNIRPLSPSSPTAAFAHYNWSQEPGSMNEFWRESYAIIRSASFVIEDVDKYSGENANKADNLKAQAYAIRAYVHFKLVNTFAQPYTFTTDASHPGVPYIITSDITKPISRQTVAEVYTGMISDLTNAINLFKTGTTDTRFINGLASKALLARMYLFKDDFANAKAQALEIADQVPLMTIANGYPIDLFKLKNPLQTEVLFHLSPRGSLERTDFIGRYLMRNPKQFVATSDIANIIKENLNDIRNNWVTQESGRWSVTKFPKGVAPEAVPPPFPEIAYYPSVIRSSEMFLTVAEASARSGDENTARTYLDAIRKRSDPTITDITAVGSALIDSIYKERRKELSFEGLRMYDLQRWKAGVQRTDVLAGSPASLPFPSNKAISPLPAADISIGGLPQNEGY